MRFPEGWRPDENTVNHLESLAPETQHQYSGQLHDLVATVRSAARSLDKAHEHLTQCPVLPVQHLYANALITEALYAFARGDFARADELAHAAASEEPTGD